MGEGGGGSGGGGWGWGRWVNTVQFARVDAEAAIILPDSAHLAAFYGFADGGFRFSNSLCSFSKGVSHGVSNRSRGTVSSTLAQSLGEGQDNLLAFKVFSRC